MTGKSEWAVGDPVVVKKHVRDPDLSTDLGGWSGVIVEIVRDEEGRPTYVVEWDSATIRRMPAGYMLACEKEEFEWERTYLSLGELDRGRPGVEAEGEVDRAILERVLHLPEDERAERD